MTTHADHITYMKNRSGARKLSDKQAVAILRTMGIFDVVVVSDGCYPPYYVNQKRNYIEFLQGDELWELKNGKIAHVCSVA